MYFGGRICYNGMAVNFDERVLVFMSNEGCNQTAPFLQGSVQHDLRINHRFERGLI